MRVTYDHCCNITIQYQYFPMVYCKTIIEAGGYLKRYEDLQKLDFQKYPSTDEKQKEIGYWVLVGLWVWEGRAGYQPEHI